IELIGPFQGNQRETEDEHKEDEGYGRGVPHTHILERITPDMEHQRRRLVAWPALCQNVDLVEGLQREDAGHDDDESGGGQKEGPGDAAELAPGAGAVYACGFVEKGGNA